MIYNPKNRSNDTSESQIEKKTYFKSYFQYSQLKITRINKICSLKSVTMLYWERESRTSLHAVQYKWQTLFWCFVLIILRMASLDPLLLCSVGQQVWLCSYLVLKLFAKIKAFALIKLFLQNKKECNIFNFAKSWHIILLFWPTFSRDILAHLYLKSEK